MAQMPIKDKTFAVLNSLKNKSIQARNGKAITWDNVIVAMSKIANKYETEFINIMVKFEARKHEK